MANNWAGTQFESEGTRARARLMRGSAPACDENSWVAGYAIVCASFFIVRGLFVRLEGLEDINLRAAESARGAW